MRLLIDLGNSRLKWGCWSGGALSPTGISPHPRAGLDAALAFLGELPAQPMAVHLASTAGAPVTAALCEGLRTRLESPVMLARTAVSAGALRNGYANPAQLGVDRWLAMRAAWRADVHGVCVVDAGTALTIDAVAAAGQHLGGLILPGTELMQAALVRETGDLGERSAHSPPASAAVASLAEPWARDTRACIAGGTALAHAALVRHCASALQALGPPVSIVVTGGSAEPLLAALGCAAEHRPHLVLEGLVTCISDTEPHGAADVAAGPG